MKRMVKIYLVIPVVVVLSGLSVAVFAGNFETKLPDTDGTSSFQVQDSTGTVLMEVESDGDVGIGTTTPTSGYELHVYDGTNSSYILSESASTTGHAMLAVKGSSGQQYNVGVGGGSEVAFGVAEKFFVFDATASTMRMTIDTSGQVGIGTTTPTRTLDVVGSGRFEGSATSVLTGSIDPDGTTTVAGVGTKFLTELAIGDRITVSGEDRIVSAIASDTSLTIVSAFTDTANDTSPDKAASGLIVLGGIRARGGMPGPMGINNNGFAFGGITGDADSGMYSNNDGELKFYTNNNLSVQLDNTSSANFMKWDGGGGWVVNSDRRLKTGIEDAHNFLEKVMGLKVRQYYFKRGDKRDFKRIGFIAQEVEPFFPEVVSTTTEHPDIEGESKMLGYSTFGVIAIQALQELKVEKDEEIALLSTELKVMKNRLAVLENGNEAIAMLNVSAKQELYKKIKSLETENTDLKAKMKKVEEIQAENEAFRKELMQIKKIVYEISNNKRGVLEITDYRLQISN